jgi:hypothetical protein
MAPSLHSDQFEIFKNAQGLQNHPAIAEIALLQVLDPAQTLLDPVVPELDAIDDDALGDK